MLTSTNSAVATAAALGRAVAGTTIIRRTTTTVGITPTVTQTLTIRVATLEEATAVAMAGAVATNTTKRKLIRPDMQCMSGFRYLILQ